MVNYNYQIPPAIVREIAEQKGYAEIIYLGIFKGDYAFRVSKTSDEDDFAYVLLKKNNQASIIIESAKIIEDFFFKSSCVSCEWLDSNGFTCYAFWKGIPDDIMRGDNKHTEVVKGQMGSCTFYPKAPEY